MYMFENEIPAYLLQREKFYLIMEIVCLLWCADLQCVQTNTVWKPDTSSVNNELYAGYRDGNSDKAINEIPVGKNRVLIESFFAQV